MHRLVLCISLGFALIAFAITASAAPGELSEQIVPEMLGVSVDLNSSSIPQIADAGFGLVSISLDWPKVEKARGEYDFSAYDELMASLSAKGLRPIVVLGEGNPLYDNGEAPRTVDARAAFAAFAKAAASHFADRNIIWEIWNEPNLEASWKPTPNADDYVALARIASSVIKSSDATATVVGPGLAGVDIGFLSRCLESAMLESIDAVSFHPRCTAIPERLGADYSLMKGMIQKSAPSGKSIPIICSGLICDSGDLTPENRSDCIQRMTLTNVLNGVKASVCKPDTKAAQDRPVCPAIEKLTRELRSCKFVTRLGSKSDEYLLLFGGEKGYRIAAWTTGEQRSVALTTDASKVTVVNADGTQTEVSSQDGKVNLTLNQSPVYIRVGESKRLTLEESLSVVPSLQTSWRVQDAINVEVTNPLAQRVRGELILSAPGNKLEKRKVDLSPGKSVKYKFLPGITWDGSNDVAVQVSMAVEGLLAPIVRNVEVATAHRVYAYVCSPIDRILEFRVISPLNNRMRGKLRITDVSGIKLRANMSPFEVEAQAVVPFTLDEPAPREFCFGYELVDATNKVVFKSPARKYTIVEDFIWAVEDAPLARYDTIIDGNEDVAGNMVAQGALRATMYPALPKMQVCKLWYAAEAGEKYFRLSPISEMLIPQNALQVGYWTYGDNSGGEVRCRYIDSAGRLVEPGGFPVDFTGWRYRTISLVGNGVSNQPVRWDSLFLFDMLGKDGNNTIFVGPVMVVSQLDQPTEVSE